MHVPMWGIKKKKKKLNTIDSNIIGTARHIFFRIYESIESDSSYYNNKKIFISRG